jgi:uncharacterized protein YqeY
MTIQEYVIRDMKQAMLDKRIPQRDLLRVVMGEFNREGKEVSDERALKIIKKMYENAIEFGNSKEAQILGFYLPKLLDLEELTINIEHYVIMHKLTIKDMGRVMSFLKKNYEGLYNGGIASGIVREILLKQES